jgi:hypothetical protein
MSLYVVISLFKEASKKTTSPLFETQKELLLVVRVSAVYVAEVGEQIV